MLIVTFPSFCRPPRNLHNLDHHSWRLNEGKNGPRVLGAADPHVMTQHWIVAQHTVRCLETPSHDIYGSNVNGKILLFISCHWLCPQPLMSSQCWRHYWLAARLLDLRYSESHQCRRSPWTAKKHLSSMLCRFCGKKTSLNDNSCSRIWSKEFQKRRESHFSTLNDSKNSVKPEKSMRMQHLKHQISFLGSKRIGIGISPTLCIKTN